MKEDVGALVYFDELVRFTEADYAAVASRLRSADGKLKLRSYSCSTEPARYVDSSPGWIWAQDAAKCLRENRKQTIYLSRFRP